MDVRPGFVGCEVDERFSKWERHGGTTPEEERVFDGPGPGLTRGVERCLFHCNRLRLDFRVRTHFCFWPGVKAKIWHEPGLSVSESARIGPLRRRGKPVVGGEDEFDVWERVGGGDESTMERKEGCDAAGVDAALSVEDV